jgi:ribosomal protein L22
VSPRAPKDPDKGKVDEAQAEAAAAESKEAAAKKEAAEPAEQKPRRRSRRKTATPKAEGTAAEETGVGKDAAEAALKEGTGEPVASEASAPEADAAAAAAGEEAPEPVTDPEPAAPAAETAAPAEEAPSPARRRRRRAAAAEEPAEPAEQPTRSRRERAPGELVTVRAHAKYVRTSARKARLVCDHIRGKSVQEARAILAHTPRAVARDWSKLLESAVANAEHNHELVGDELRIHSVTADEGPTLKRFRPRAMGRATRIRKRTSHLTITLTPKG